MEKKCKDLVQECFNSTISDIRKLWEAYCEDSEKYLDDLGRFSEYGLSFDYVEPGTFDDQPEGYFRYQISWGGPSIEFRFYVNPDLTIHRIEYWYVDWFDGASLELSGNDFSLMAEVFESFSPESLLDEDSLS